MPIYGVDIGGTKCAVCVADADGRPRELERFATLDPAASIARIADIINAHRKAHPPLVAPVIGIACGGPLDAEAGVILSPPNLPGWDQIPIVAELERRCEARAALMNDANADALAEGRHGAGRGCRTFIFLTMGTGMGAGLVINGRLHTGASGDAGEVGHLRLADNGPVGFGKAGSFEGFCSGGGIARLALLRAPDHPHGGPWRDRPPTDISAATLAVAAREGDPFARAIWHEVGTRLGQALALLVDVLNPERIIIGSIFVRCPDLLVAPMQHALLREALPSAARRCAVVPAALGEQLGNFAALAVAEHALSLDPSTPPFRHDD